MLKFFKFKFHTGPPVKNTVVQNSVRAMRQPKPGISLGLLVVVSSFIASAAADCHDGYEFQSEIQTCFKYVTDPKPFANAVSFCQSTGGRVFSASTGARNSFLLNLGGGATESWIGLQYLTGNWNW